MHRRPRSSHPPAHLPPTHGRLQHARPSQRRHVPQREYYRAGRALAKLLILSGWGLAVLGCALLPALFVLGAPLAYGLAAMIAMVAGAIAAGMFLVLIGQSARAVFDQADATRELVALERAKAGHE